MVDLVTSLILAAGMLRFLKVKMVEHQRPRASIRESHAVLGQALKKHGRRIIGLSMVTVCFSANITFVPLLFARRGQANTDISAMILLANAVLVILSAKPLRLLTRHWGAQRIGEVGTVFIAAGVCFAPLTSSWTWVLFGLVLWTIGEVIFLPWEQLQLFNCFDNASTGMASGAVSFLFSICQILAPVFSTLLLALPDRAAAALLVLTPILGYWIYRSSLKLGAESVEVEGDGNAEPWVEVGVRRGA